MSDPSGPPPLDPPERLQRVDDRVVADDPFWSVVRRRHPDVDLVLLPPPDGPADVAGVAGRGEGSTVPTEIAHSAVEMAWRTWTSVAPLLSAAGADGSPSVRWRTRAAGSALLVKKAVVGPSVPQRLRLMRDVADLLIPAGWEVRGVSRGPVRLLHAAGGLVDVVGETGAAASTLTIGTGLIPLSDAARAELLAEVRSWA